MGLTNWKKESAAVYHAPAQHAVTRADVARLKKLSPGGRVRLCLHAGPAAAVQEMIIALPRGEYVRPHKHAKAGETYQILEGRVAFFEFDAKGAVGKVVRASAEGAEPFLFRQSAGRYHGLLVLTPWLVFRETKPGPFERKESGHAPWSPEPDDAAGVAAYLSRLRAALGGNA